MDGLGAVVEDPPEHPPHQQRVGEGAERTERQLVVDDVAHFCAARHFAELVKVVPVAVRAAQLQIDEALTRLERHDLRKAQVAMLRLFSGASVAETADALGVSEVTVMRDWRFARAWLHRELEG